MSRVAVLSHFTSLSVVELKENCLSLSQFKFCIRVVVCRGFILFAVATFWAMSLVGIYPGRASVHAPLSDFRKNLLVPSNTNEIDKRDDVIALL